MKSELKLLVLPGDGIGREVVDAGLRVLDTACAVHRIALHVQHDQIGGETWDRHGTFCLDRTIETAQSVDAVLVGATGGPKWDSLSIDGTIMEKDGLMKLRHKLDTYAGLRPTRSYTALLSKTPFRKNVVRNSDILVLREMCGGCFFREPKGITVHHDGSRDGYDNYLYSSREIERIARTGFDLARRRKKRLASLDKSNVMESGILWRDCVTQIGREYPDVTLEHYYADNGLYQMMRRPSTFDVVLGDNLLGDIGSDLAATVAGSLGMLPSACVPGLDYEGLSAGPGIYEPVHGSAPDIAGQNIANPIGAILSVSMMLTLVLARDDIARKIEYAVEQSLQQGNFTRDLGGTCSTSDMTDQVIKCLKQQR